MKRFTTVLTMLLFVLLFAAFASVPAFAQDPVPITASGFAVLLQPSGFYAGGFVAKNLTQANLITGPSITFVFAFPSQQPIQPSYALGSVRVSGHGVIITTGETVILLNAEGSDMGCIKCWAGWDDLMMDLTAEGSVTVLRVHGLSYHLCP